MGADIALFPEMWSNGYAFPGACGDYQPNVFRAPQRWREDPRRTPAPDPAAHARWLAGALATDGPYVTAFRSLARELGLAIAITYLQRWPGKPRNAVSLIDRHGALRFTYAKVHTCDFSAGEWQLTSGDDFCVADLDTAAGSVKVGAMICYDREFPESARILMLKGAEMILTPNACTLEIHRLGQFRARAYENMVGVAMANYAAPNANGHSVAYDPIAFDAQGSRDTTVVAAGEEEGIYLARFDLDALRDWRTREIWGNAFRRPHRYAALTSFAVDEPFRRVDEAGRPYDAATR
jgi:predicted amidohydrolase